MRRPKWLLLAVAAIAVSAVIAVIIHQRSSQEVLESTAAGPLDLEDLDTSGLIGRPRPDFRLDDAGGMSRQAAEWDGRVLVVNFWATWCIPCRSEIPVLVDLQDLYARNGLQIVGIALDERDQVNSFFDDLGLRINYPVLVGGEAAGISIAKEYGNAFGILPYTVIVDRNGKIAFVQFGELTREQAERSIQDLL